MANYQAETKNFKKFNPNPRAVGYKKKTWDRCDCTTRAFCKFLDKDWVSVFKMQIEVALEIYDEPNSNEVTKIMVQNLNLHKASNVKGDNRQTAYTFALDNPIGTYILSLAGHLVCVKDGVIYDTWNCGEKSVYNAYYAEGTPTPKMKRTRTKLVEYGK